MVNRAGETYSADWWCQSTSHSSPSSPLSLPFHLFSPYLQPQRHQQAPMCMRGAAGAVVDDPGAWHGPAIDRWGQPFLVW